MQFLNKNVAPLGLGCWPIGGKMFAADGQSLGYAKSDDVESVKALHAALECGINLFDTAAAYGAGHSERLLGRAFKNRPDALIVTTLAAAGVTDQANEEALYVIAVTCRRPATYRPV